MEVKVTLSGLQQSTISGHEHEAAARLICELAKFCLYEHNQIPSVYDTLKVHTVQQQAGVGQKLATARGTASDRRATKFISGTENIFNTITATSIASLDSKLAAIVIGPSLMRPSLVYQFDYSALTHGLQRQPADSAAGILEHTPRGFTKRSDADAQEPMLLHADSQIELDTSVHFMGNTLRHESIDKTIQNIAKKVVRALVVNASTTGTFGKNQGGQKLHVLLLGPCTPDPPTGLLPKRTVSLQHKKAHIVRLALVDSESRTIATAADHLSTPTNECGQMWYQCGKPVKGLRMAGNRE